MRARAASRAAAAAVVGDAIVGDASSSCELGLRPPPLLAVPRPGSAIVLGNRNSSPSAAPRQWLSNSAPAPAPAPAPEPVAALMRAQCTGLHSFQDNEQVNKMLGRLKAIPRPNVLAVGGSVKLLTKPRLQDAPGPALETILVHLHCVDRVRLAAALADISSTCTHRSLLAASRTQAAATILQSAVRAHAVRAHSVRAHAVRAHQDAAKYIAKYIAKPALQVEAGRVGAALIGYSLAYDDVVIADST